ncbi:MAG: hypothetical protein ACFE8M_00995 [Candidatus Hermodarchaeota archaeon]
MKKKIEVGRQSKYILACFLIHFLFFGYICNVYEKSIGENILFLHRAIFNPSSYLSAIILFAIVFITVYRERFFEYGIRNSIWLILFIIFESWIWYWFINGFDILIIFIYFTKLETLLTILSLLGINLLSAFLGASLKQRYLNSLKKLKTIS